MNTAIIIGFIILGICLIGAAFIVSGAITGAASALKNHDNPVLQQPTMRYLTEFDAADYLGVSLNELDYMRSEGLLDNTFIAVTSLEQTGEEAYDTFDDGVQVSKNRAVMSSVTRFLFNTDLLDKRMLELISEGQHINPMRKKSKNSDKSSKKLSKHEDTSADASSSETLPPLPAKRSDNNNGVKHTGDNIHKSAASSDSMNHSKGNIHKPAPAGSKPGQRPMPKRPVSGLPVEDDSDMKIVRSEGGKKNVTVYSDSASSDAESPVYSSFGDQGDSNIPIVKASHKSIPKPRIAVIANDDGDEE